MALCLFWIQERQVGMDRKHGRTRATIQRLIEFDTTASNSDIARALGISRQAVSQHVHRMSGLPTRQKLFRTCAGCRSRIGWKSGSGMCHKCRTLSYTYEFVCAFCGSVQHATGMNASVRRNLDSRYAEQGKVKRNFCSIAHANKFNRKLWSRLNKLDRASR